MLDSKFEFLKVELIEIRVKALEGVHSDYRDTHEDPKLVSMQVLYDDYWVYRMIKCISEGSISSGYSTFRCSHSD